MQKCASIRSTEAEHVALPQSPKVLVWPGRDFKELDIKQSPIMIIEGNRVTIFHKNRHSAKDSKQIIHIKLLNQFIRHAIENGEIPCKH